MDNPCRRADYAAAKALLAGARSVLVSGHLSPDGDSLGSMIALARMLTAAGWQAVVFDFNSVCDWCEILVIEVYDFD